MISIGFAFPSRVQDEHLGAWALASLRLGKAAIVIGVFDVGSCATYWFNLREWLRALTFCRGLKLAYERQFALARTRDPKTTGDTLPVPSHAAHEQVVHWSESWPCPSLQTLRDPHSVQRSHNAGVEILRRRQCIAGYIAREHTQLDGPNLRPFMPCGERSEGSMEGWNTGLQSFAVRTLSNVFGVGEGMHEDTRAPAAIRDVGYEGSGDTGWYLYRASYCQSFFDGTSLAWLLEGKLEHT